MLGSTDEALRWARIGRNLLIQDTPNATNYQALNPSPQRTLAEAFFRGYTSSKVALNAAEAELLKVAK